MFKRPPWKPTTQQNIEEIPTWVSPVHRAEVEALLALQPNNECRATVMNALFSHGISLLCGDSKECHAVYRPMSAPAKADNEDMLRKGWHRREYLIAGEDGGPQLETRYGWLGLQRSYPATRCWSSRVFRKSSELCDYDPSQTTSPSIISTEHLAVYGYWDVSPKHTEIRELSYEDRVEWMSQMIDSLGGHLSQPEWTKVTLLMDPVYYETGLLLWLKLRCLSVETPFADRPTEAAKLQWIRARRAEIRKEQELKQKQEDQRQRREEAHATHEI